MYVYLRIREFELVCVGDFLSRNSAVGIATTYCLDDRGVGVPSPGSQDFLLLHVVQARSGVHPTS
jgi:hypothetical protein